MTSLDAQAGSVKVNKSSAMDLDSLCLSKYLDLLPQPAMIFTYENGSLNADTLAVAYANQVFLDSIGDSPLIEDEEPIALERDPSRATGIAADFMTILQTQCINPSASQFFHWVNGVTQEPKNVHHLKTRFKGFFIPNGGHISERKRQLVDIEWNGIVMENRFIVLTGRRTGTLKFSSDAPPSLDPPRRGISHPETVEEEEEREVVTVEPEVTALSEETTATSSSSSNSSNPTRKGRKKTKRAISSTTTQSDQSRTKSKTKSKSRNNESRGYEGDTWRHNAKTVKAMGGGGTMGILLRDKDWTQTALGPVDNWSQTLLTMVSLVMASTHPMSMWWGEESVLIYNDGYIPIAGELHPAAFGERAQDHWHGLWNVLEPIIENGLKGESIYSEDQCLIMQRHGYTEETYFTWSYIPIREESGDVCGLLNPCFESTDRILAERRLRTLRELDSHTAFARCIADLGKPIAKALTFNPYDVPFALVYFCSTDFGTNTLYTSSTNPGSTTRDLSRRMSLQSTQSSSLSGTDRTDPSVWAFHLQAVVGIPDGHILAPKTVEIHLEKMDMGLGQIDVDDSEVHIWPFRKMAEQQTAIDIRHLTPEMLAGVTHQGWPELPTEAIAIPIQGVRDMGGKDSMMGMLVLGINPRRAFDSTYQTFAKMCGRQIASSMMMVRNIEDETGRAEDLAALNRDRTSFFQSVSHELRTPLTLVLGPLEECLEDPSLSQQHKSRLDMVRRNARRLLRLVNSLLDFSRVEAGKMGATFKETNLQKYTADLASLFRSAIEKGGVKYIVDTSGKERNVWVDRDMWEKIVFNLIGNAFKFTLSGQITVTCGLAEDGRHMLFTVRDTGTGIPTHEINRIFEKFHRVHDQKGRSYEGTGIGLALTQELVKLHGGKLDVESAYGQGTVFSIQLRIGNTHLPQEQLFRGPDFSDLDTPSTRAYGQSVVEEAGRWALKEAQTDSIAANPSGGQAYSTTSSDNHSALALQPGQWVPISSRGCRILIADDNEDMRRYIKGVLLQFYDILEASNGQDALAIAVSENPDLILSDVMMPGLDGFGLLKVLRSSPETRSTPFILVSARAGEDARVEGLLAGADDYLAKPFNARELIARVHTHLDIARMRLELEKRVKERTKDLMESEARYRILTAISPVGIFRVDTSGIVTYANQRWREITGVTERLDDSAGESYLSSVHPEDREWISDCWRNALENTESYTFEVRWGTRDSFRWAMGEVVPEVIEDELYGFIGVLTDVTERREMEREKLDAAEEVRAQQELAIDVICHELRNPLNGIYHNADIVFESMTSIRDVILKFRDEMLQTNNLHQQPKLICTPEESQALAHLIDFLDTELVQDLESLEALNLCAKHQKRIADDVLQMSKLSMNLVSLTEIPFDPLVETSNVIRMFEREAFVKNVAFKFTLGSAYRDLRIEWVRADPIRFAQVLLNFISNAVRFTEKSPRREIEVTLDASDVEPKLSQPLTTMTTGDPPPQKFTKTHPDDLGEPVFLIASVSDSGVGLTPDERANLFRKFAQASPRTHIEYGGSGLGLFISKALVDVQGGQISLESEKNKGTTLTFYIQATRVETPATPVAVAHKSRSVSPKILTPRIKRNPSSTSSISQIKTINVLVVEDNLINQRVLTRQLELAGFHTAVANHGVECLEMLENAAFDIILMDVEMPVMDGISAASEIRKREAEGDLPVRTPIIAVTGNARREYVDIASSTGIDSFIVKPYEKQDLIDKIRVLVKH